ncbi:phosphatase PAP2 family protein [Polluticaenibacter yanchengensis]|uniref:Phosphatase PAP2 family protein n=1 Tax=Polluticaenibacter yanchengensis TaxID=3014562 RepID=A0ABT4UK67_9BACT|nr:phosphatase PAP2 family protein [Chitinophagaceae bacterium LY-5]
MVSINKNLLILIIVLSNICRLSAQDPIQNTDNFVQDSLTRNDNHHNSKLNYRHWIPPTLFIGFGIAGLESDALQKLNISTRAEIKEHQPRHISLDNYTQYAPAAIVYGLNVAGIKGTHNLRERTIIYATSQLISAAFVMPLKHIVKEERPNGANNLSFPSGHTATAFSSAQFMFREYKDSNFWLSISGYPFAIFTGAYRTINDKHWLGDVVAGAGIGILSTELAYRLYPGINRLLSGKEKNTKTMLIPYYQNKNFGIGLVQRF